MSVLVAVIPEGLPVSVTLSLTVIAKALADAKVLCKSLTTVETLGSVNVLCSDKTGTLTQNRMFVQTASVLDKEFSTEEARISIMKGDEQEALHQLHLVAGLCNAATFDASTVSAPISQRKINGDATDTAILRFAEEMGSVNYLSQNWKLEFELPFNSKNKYMVLSPSGPGAERYRFECIKQRARKLAVRYSLRWDRLKIALKMMMYYFLSKAHRTFSFQIVVQLSSQMALLSLSTMSLAFELPNSRSVGHRTVASASFCLLAKSSK